jgi:hypothetical protein
LTHLDVIALLARRYGKMPHEVVALPLHYYLFLRKDWIRENMAEAKAIERAKAKAEGDDVIEFDAEAAQAGKMTGVTD